MTIDSVITFCGFACVICIGIVVMLATGSVDIGCHVIGSELNKNNEIEYLMLGNC